MKYKGEVLVNSRVYKEYYFSSLSHPNQVMRNITRDLKNKLKYYIVLIINEYGEIWKYSVMKKKDGKFYIRKMAKSDVLYTRDDLDMIFTGNKHIL